MAVTITCYIRFKLNCAYSAANTRLAVIQIGQNAFHSKNIIDISIPIDFTHIGDWAFRYNQLTSVTIPKRCFYP